MKLITSRFAPSPTGYLHLGHAYSAVLAARSCDQFILRIEDIDKGRCRPEYVAALIDDLQWLGLTWDAVPRIQSEHYDFYQKGLTQLNDEGLLYPCFCTRKDIQDEIARATHAPHGPEGALYPGTCKNLDPRIRAEKIEKGLPFALRLHMDRACQKAGPLSWFDHKQGRQRAAPEQFGDIILGRKDVPTSYHLSVCLDDHLQGINRVVRAQDLFEATHIHRLLQELLGLDSPHYLHHPLILGEDGKRLAKRDKSLTIRNLREKGITQTDLLERIGLLT